MKAKNLQTLAREAEVTRELSATASPKISYSQTLASWFLWQEQEYHVGSCPLPILRAFLEHHSAQLSVKRRNAWIDAMSCLDESYGSTGRWQAIDTLLFHKVILPLRF
jgi:hypothetical protein